MPHRLAVAQREETSAEETYNNFFHVALAQGLRR
jgi:hypothetical protein